MTKCNQVCESVARAEASAGGIANIRVLFASLATLLLMACASAPKLEDGHIVYVSERLRQPKVCATFSGGGIRSAAVSIGALQALHDSGLLDDIDLISATSGGSWALLWLYANAAKEPDLQSVLGGPGDAEPRALENVDKRTFMNRFWRGWTGFWSLVRAGKAAYHADLNAKFGSGELYTYPESIIATAATKRLPAPIVTLSSNGGSCLVDSGLSTLNRDQLSSIPLEERLQEFTPLSERVVEVSPLDWGNAYYGFSSEFPYELANLQSWAMLSGAIIDYPRNKSCRLMQAAGMSWGASVDVNEDLGFVRDAGRIFLADGGFAENLGAYPAMRRGCDLTVIFDMEHDPYLRFEGFQKLKRQTQSSLGKRIHVPQVEKWLSTHPNTDAFRADDRSLAVVRQPVSIGEVLDENAGVIGSVLYAKLTYDPSNAIDYGEQVAKFYDDNSNKCKSVGSRGRSEHCSFPHTPTFKTAYTAEEFKAHRMLGAAIFKNHLLPLLETHLRTRELPKALAKVPDPRSG